MQNLGISDPVVKSENWVKRLLWPSIRNDEDVHSITEQGLWLCLFVAGASFVFAVMGGQLIAGAVDALFFALAGFGIRQRSLPTAVIAFLVYALSTYLILHATLNPMPFVRLIFAALLLANIRGIWLARKWTHQGGPVDLSTPAYNDTLIDKLTDVWPAKIWRLGRYVFYLVALVMGVLLLLSVVIVVFRIQLPQ